MFRPIHQMQVAPSIDLIATQRARRGDLVEVSIDLARGHVVIKRVELGLGKPHVINATAFVVDVSEQAGEGPADDVGPRRDS